MIDATLSPTSLVTRALTAVLARIVDGTYGQALPTQEALAQDLKVSRTVVREAIVILRFCNVLNVRPKIGTKINPRAMWKTAILEMAGD